MRETATCTCCGTVYSVAEMIGTAMPNRGGRNAYMCRRCAELNRSYHTSNNVLQGKAKANAVYVGVECETSYSDEYARNIMFDYGFIPTHDCSLNSDGHGSRYGIDGNTCEYVSGIMQGLNIVSKWAVTAEKLIVDGRIHPARIEEMVEKAQKEVEIMIKEEGEAATLEVGVHGIHPELVRLLGKMKFRTSYGQNALKHSIEVAQLSGLLAAELGLDVRVAKRAGLLHDIGKAVDHEMEGSHIQLGVELCRKYKESPIVINAVEAHHGDVEPQSLVACLVQASDTISAARPGARRETLETYTTRLKQLEDITNNFKGVDKSFAIQAGREIRVMVVPEQISDSDMVLLARDISKQIEAELEYPGQIKVNVIRESRVIDYAK